MSGNITMAQLVPHVRSLLRGNLLGDVYVVDGDKGNDHATGEDFDHAIKSVAAAVKHCTTGNHDFILCCGAETFTAALVITEADLHIIGVGNGGIFNEHARGYQITCAATVDTIQPSTAADGLEIAGIRFVQSATDHTLIDDAGLTGGFFHHNTVKGSGTASDAVRLDIEGDQWCISHNDFWHCKLPIDLAAADCVVKKNMLQSQDTAAKGVVVGAVAHYTKVLKNIFNLGGGTGDIGVTITASADYCVIGENKFHGDVSDCISDAGTDTMIYGNMQAGITGTSGASLWLAVED